MKLNFTILFFIFVGLISSAFGSNESNFDSTIKDAARVFTKYELAWIPTNIETPVAVDPEAFDVLYEFSFQSSAEDELVRESIINTNISLTNDASDIRWRLKLFNKQGALIGSIYFNQTGEYGYFQGKNVKLKNNNLIGIIRTIMNKQLSTNFESSWLTRLLRFFE